MAPSRFRGAGAIDTEAAARQNPARRPAAGQGGQEFFVQTDQSSKVAGDDGRYRRHRILSGLAYALVTVTIFGGWFVVTRLGVTRALRIWDITALRFGVGAVLLAPVLWAKRSRYSPAEWRDGLLFSALWGAPFVLLVSYGLGLTSAAGASSTVPTMMPVIAGLLAWAFLGEKPEGQRLLGFVAIVCGMLLMTWLSSGAGRGSLLGFFSLIGASTLWSIYTLVYRGSRLQPLEAAGFICLWSALLYVPIYLWLGVGHLAEASATELALQVVYQGVLVGPVAIVIFSRAVAQLGAGVTSAIMALVPVMATLLAVIVLGEVPTGPEALAIVLVTAGVVLAAGRIAKAAPALA